MRNAKRRTKHPISAQEGETSKRTTSVATKEVSLPSDVDLPPRHGTDEYADLVNNARLSFDELCEFFNKQMELMSSAIDEPDEPDDDEDDVDDLEPVIAADSLGKSEVKLRAKRAEVLEGLLTIDFAKELTVLSAMDVETIDPARHVKTMTALLRASEYATGFLLAIDEIGRQVAKGRSEERRDRPHTGASSQ